MNTCHSQLQVALGSCANGRGSALRHDNIAVGWLIEAVQNHVAEPTVERYHDARGRRHRDLHAGHCGDVLRPGTRCIDDKVGAQGFGLAVR